MLFSQKEKSVIYDAFDMYYADYCNALPSNEDLSYITFTKEFEEKMQKLIEREQKFYFYWINTVGKRVAIILLTILITFTTITFSVKALREQTVSFIIETFEKFSNIVFVNDKSNADITFEAAIPAYIPEGYTLDIEINTPPVYQARYFNDDKTRCFTYTQIIDDGTTLRTNTENVTYENIYINNYEGIIYSNKGNNTVIFNTDEYAFSFTGTISKDELVKIAESIGETKFETVTPTYIPNGFTVQSSDLSSVTYDVLYVGEDNDSTILYCQFVNDATIMQINTEKTNYEEFTVNDHAAIYYSNKGHNTIVISGEKYIFMVQSTTPKEELIKIAESIEIK